MAKFGNRTKCTATAADCFEPYAKNSIRIMEIGADAPLIADAYNETLSYDETVPYEEQVPSLADRIGRGKVYLLEDSSIVKSGKVRALGRGASWGSY